MKSGADYFPTQRAQFLMGERLEVRSPEGLLFRVEDLTIKHAGGLQAACARGFRVGIEGRISVLFRGRGMKRCRAKGRARLEVFWPLRDFTDLHDVNRQARQWLAEGFGGGHT